MPQSWPAESTERRAIDAVRAQALAGGLPVAAFWLGLGGLRGQLLLASQGIAASLVAAPAHVPDIEAEAPELLTPLLDLIWAHRAQDDAATRLIAGTLACACFGSRHLWQDLGLQGRAEVSGLLTHYAPALAAGNTRGLKWKRYLFETLGERLGRPGLRPPHCEGCEDFDLCFGSHATTPTTLIYPSRRGSTK